MSVLVTGGAGYIGAHVVRLLQEAEQPLVVLDDLSTGSADRVGGAPLVRLDLAAPGAVEGAARAMSDHGVTSVIHFAARKQVGESVERPVWYYQQNVTGLANLLEAMERAEVDRLVFSSSAAVYGSPASGRVDETDPTEPVNPYGETKLVGEWLIRGAAHAWGLRSVALRYFNVAGAGWPELGDPAIMNLVTMVLDRLARGERPRVFGADYPTPDGTCVRDFVHVLDLATAHVDALRYLQRDDRPFDVFNVGTGHGASVLDVVRLLGEVSGRDTTPEVVGRRAGDPAQVVAAVDRIESSLGWHARAQLRDVVESAWLAWQAGPHPIQAPSASPTRS